MPGVSILMSARNAENYLHDCMESLFSQSFQDWELIAVDDFSEDRTFEILEFYANKDKRVKVFRNAERGIIPALSLAFMHSRGTYISRMDADDIMPPAKLKELLKIAREGKRKVATGKVSYFSEGIVSEGYQRYQNWLNEIVVENSFNKNIYRECVVASPNWMTHRSCFETEIFLNELSYPEDYDLVFQWYKKGFNIAGTNKHTHLWREHSERTSRNSEIYQQESFFRLKTNYFIDLELTAGEKVQLIGTGKKGKLVAGILAEKSIEFDWFEYKAEQALNIFPVENSSSDFKTILTNWPVNKDMQNQIKKFLDSKGFIFGKNIWLF